MKPRTSSFPALLAMVLGATMAVSVPTAAQTPVDSTRQADKPRYTLFLRDGSVIKCLRFQLVPDSALTVWLTNGEIVKFGPAEFLRVTPEEVSGAAGTSPQTPAPLNGAAGASPEEATRPPGSHRLTIAPFASLCPPVGSFGSSDLSEGGGATLGYGFGLELAIPLGDRIDWVLSVAMQFYGVEIPGIMGVSMNTGSWRMILPMTGPRFSTPLSDAVGLFGEVMIGWNAQTSPEMSFNIMGYGASVPSGSAGALAYSIGAGLTFAEIVQLRARYIDGGTPEYTIMGTVISQSMSFSLRQQTRTVEISLGVVI